MTAVSLPEQPAPSKPMTDGNWLFAQHCQFIAATATIERLPPAARPEIAFAGRSNVGKSSLVNALTGRRTLARTSHTPGRTQTLNFFTLAERLDLVDLPGYGYAKVSRSLSRQWMETVRAYLGGRPSLIRVMLLIDARHGIKPSDRAVMDLMDGAAVSYQLVLTKADKCKAGDAAEVLQGVAEEGRRRVAAHPEVLATSAHKGTGVGALRQAIATLVDDFGFSYKSSDHDQ